MDTQGGRDAYDPAKDALACYELACRALRERCVRVGDIPPDPTNPQELRQAQEGVVPWKSYDCVREWMRA